MRLLSSLCFLAVSTVFPFSVAAVNEGGNIVKEDSQGTCMVQQRVQQVAISAKRSATETTSTSADTRKSGTGVTWALFSRLPSAVLEKVFHNLRLTDLRRLHEALELKEASSEKDSREKELDSEYWHLKDSLSAYRAGKQVSLDRVVYVLERAVAAGENPELSREKFKIKIEEMRAETFHKAMWEEFSPVDVSQEDVVIECRDLFSYEKYLFLPGSFSPLVPKPFSPYEVPPNYLLSLVSLPEKTRCINMQSGGAGQGIAYKNIVGLPLGASNGSWFLLTRFLLDKQPNHGPKHMVALANYIFSKDDLCAKLPRILLDRLYGELCVYMLQSDAAQHKFADVLQTMAQRGKSSSLDFVNNQAMRFLGGEKAFEEIMRDVSGVLKIFLEQDSATFKTVKATYPELFDFQSFLRSDDACD